MLRFLIYSIIAGDFLRAEGGSKGGCHFADFMRVVGEGLPAGMGLVVGGMGVWLMLLILHTNLP